MNNQANREGYEKYSEAWKNNQELMQDFIRLNTETFKNFQAFKPEELGKINRPDELWEKQLQWGLQGAEQSIEYLQKSLQIIGKALHSFTEECKANVKKH